MSWAGEASHRVAVPGTGQELSEPGEDASEDVADSGENDVGGVAGAAFAVAAAEMTFGR